MEAYKIGLVGWGTVGGGVLEVLARDGALLRERCGLDIELKAIVTRDPARAREQDPGSASVGTDLDVILNDPEIGTVLHLVGGVDAATEIAVKCLRAGKHVVTANKAMLAERWDEVVGAAREAGKSIAFEAAVAGGIPVIAALRDGLVANRIPAFHAILNGTCNYILTQMEEQGWGYDEALAQAKALGYAEADPTLDVDGTDTAHKLAILARIAFTTQIPFSSVNIEGIQAITAEDIASAKRMGSRIKLLAVAKQRDEGLELRVAPTLVPLDNPLAAVSANYNAVRILADAAGPTLLIGQGAGALPTASAVLADLVDVATGRYQETANRFRFFGGEAGPQVLPEEDEVTASYGRFRVKDRSGVLAELTGLLSRHGVSLLSVHQSEPDAAGVAVFEVTTHPVQARDFFSAVRAIDAADFTVAPSVILRRMSASGE